GAPHPDAHVSARDGLVVITEAHLPAACFDRVRIGRVRLGIGCRDQPEVAEHWPRVSRHREGKDDVPPYGRPELKDADALVKGRRCSKNGEAERSIGNWKLSDYAKGYVSEIQLLQRDERACPRILFGHSAASALARGRARRRCAAVAAARGHRRERSAGRHR